MSQEIISYHNFMFPFRFDKINDEIVDKHKFYRDNDFDKRVVIDEKFKDSLENSGWVYKKFEVKNSLDYNEIVYFHDFVKDSLYNIKDFNDKDKATSYYFSKEVKYGDSFTLYIKNAKEYSLNLTNLSLRIFDTGVAILSIELENYKYNSIDDILKINDFGRRIYPQFLDQSNFTEETKKSFLADKIEIKLGNNYFCEDFKYTSFPQDIKIASYIMDILGDTFTREKDKKNKYYIQPSVDDRMFVVCWYGNTSISETLKNYKYEKSSRWYELVFVDGGGKTVQSPRMQEKLIQKATYDRWMEWGTLYGMSRYSFVCLSQQNNFTRKVLPLPHIKTMYFQIFTLLLAQRASILRFSDEVTAISDIENTKLETKTASLYKNYIRFVNKLYFREVTPQDQGLEIYNQARAILKIDDDIKDLDNEIEELHRYVSMKEEEKSAKRMNRLQVLGFPILILSLVTGFFGMNIFPNDFITTISNYLQALF